MLHANVVPTPASPGPSSPARQSERPGLGIAYRHILVPTSLAPRERSAIRLGLQLATGHPTRVTALHVVTPAPQSPNAHWLDAIDDLYQALSRPTRGAPLERDVDVLEASRRQLCAFLGRAAHPDPTGNSPIQAECRLGDIATEVPRFADKEGVDLVILCCDMSARWWPGRSQRLRRVLQSLQRQVVLVRPDHEALAGGAETMA